MIDLQSFILTFVNNFSYFGIFLLLAIIVFLPIPEEIVLLLVGYFAGFGFINLYWVTLISLIGVLAGDNLLYYFSRHRNSYISNIKKKIFKKILRKYQKKMHQHVGKTIFLSRFILGLRFFGPLLAASMKVKWNKFFIYNSLAVLIFVPLFIILGFHFHTIISIVIEKIISVKHLVFTLFLSVFGLLVSIFLHKRFLKNS